MNEKSEQLKTVMADEAFVKACIEAENEEAVQKLFAEKGVEMSLTEIEIMKEMVSAVADGRITEEQLEKLANSGELSEEELEAAAGGFGDEFFGNVKGLLFGKLTSNGPLSQSDPSLRLYEYSAAKIGGWTAAALVIGAGAIAQACGVDVVGGIKSGCSWVADKITRW